MPLRAFKLRNQNFQVVLCHSFGDEHLVWDLARKLSDDGYHLWLLYWWPFWYMREEFREIVNTSDALIICLSRRSVKDGDLELEVRYALNIIPLVPPKSLIVVPIRLDDVAIPKSLSQWPHIDLFPSNSNAYAAGYRLLIQLLTRHANFQADKKLRPRVFISYSHDSLEHRRRVWRFAAKLRHDGINALIDIYEPNPPEGFVRWMTDQIENADFVLVICTEIYLRRSQGKEVRGVGHGVAWENHLLFQRLFDEGTKSQKIIPVLFKGGKASYIPTPFRSFAYYHVETSKGYKELYRYITKQPKQMVPPLGPLQTFPPEESTEQPVNHEAVVVSGLARRMLAAQNIVELQTCLFEIDAALSKYPNNPDLRLLKQQVKQAIEREKEIAAEKRWPMFSYEMTRFKLMKGPRLIFATIPLIIIALLVLIGGPTRIGRSTVQIIRESIDRISGRVRVNLIVTPSNPQPRQNYTVVVQTTPRQVGIPVTITVDGTDSYDANFAGQTDKNGQYSVTIPGAEDGVVDIVRCHTKDGQPLMTQVTFSNKHY